MVIDTKAEECDTDEVHVLDHDSQPGSVQLNDAENTEQWIDDQFDSKVMPSDNDSDGDEDGKGTEIPDTIGVNVCFLMITESMNSEHVKLSVVQPLNLMVFFH